MTCICCRITAIRFATSASTRSVPLARMRAKTAKMAGKLLFSLPSTLHKATPGSGAKFHSCLHYFLLDDAEAPTPFFRFRHWKKLGLHLTSPFSTSRNSCSCTIRASTVSCVSGIVLSHVEANASSAMLPWYSKTLPRDDAALSVTLPFSSLL